LNPSSTNHWILVNHSLRHQKNHRTPQDSSLPELKERRGAGAMASTGGLRPRRSGGIGSSSEGALRKPTGDVVNKGVKVETHMGSFWCMYVYIYMNIYIYMYTYWSISKMTIWIWDDLRHNRLTLTHRKRHFIDIEIAWNGDLIQKIVI